MMNSLPSPISIFKPPLGGSSSATGFKISKKNHDNSCSTPKMKLPTTYTLKNDVSKLHNNVKALDKQNIELFNRQDKVEDKQAQSANQLKLIKDSFNSLSESMLNEFKQMRQELNESKFSHLKNLESGKQLERIQKVLNDQSEETTQTITQITTEQTQWRNEIKDTFSSVSSDIQTLWTHLQSIQSKSNSEKNNQAVAVVSQSEHERLSESFGQVRRGLEANQTEMDVVKTQINTIKQEVERMKKQQDVTVQLDSMASQIEATEASLKRQGNMLQQFIAADRNQEISKLQSQITSLTSNLDQFDINSKRLSQSLTSLSQKQVDIEQTVVKMENQVMHHDDIFEQLIQKVEHLERGIHSDQLEHVQRLTNFEQSLIAKIDALRRQVVLQNVSERLGTAGLSHKTTAKPSNTHTITNNHYQTTYPSHLEKGFQDSAGRQDAQTLDQLYETYTAGQRRSESAQREANMGDRVSDMRRTVNINPNRLVKSTQSGIMMSTI